MQQGNETPRPALSLTVTLTEVTTACDALARASGLPKGRIKDAMIKGAVRLKHTGHERLLRRASLVLRPGDVLTLHYDPAILALKPPTARCLADETRYSVWCKPAGMLAQGTLWGDHCALLRVAEQWFTPPRSALLVHRLDREASGLMLIAHDPRAAAALSSLFQQHKITKTYRVQVRGKPSTDNGHIGIPLEGKPASTDYALIRYDGQNDISELEVVIHTGRKHQIRRHLHAIGHPVMGDPLYGQHNKNSEGLQLTAVSLAFICPLSGRPREYVLRKPEHGCDGEDE